MCPIVGSPYLVRVLVGSHAHLSPHILTQYGHLASILEAQVGAGCQELCPGDRNRVVGTQGQAPGTQVVPAHALQAFLELLGLGKHPFPPTTRCPKYADMLVNGCDTHKC